MRPRPILWLLISLLCFGGAWYFWRWGERRAAPKPAPAAPAPATPAAPGPSSAAAAPQTVSFASTAPMPLLTRLPAGATAPAPAPLGRFPYRLSNTSKSAGQLLRDDHAILLENALVDTAQPLALGIPPHLRAEGDPGTYIVQARGPLDDAFRARLRTAGASIVAYIPNNAYLVRASAAVARSLAGDAQAVLPYEPYYKLKGALLKTAVKQWPLPEEAGLNLVLFADDAAATTEAVKQLGAEVVGEDRSPFGPVLQVRPAPKSLAALAGLPGVQTVELSHPRVAANDLSRARVGVASDPVTNVNYLGLTGTNVLVNVNDSGVDATHPDLAGRVLGDFPATLLDRNGHGTHVAGIIASSGGMSLTVTNAGGSPMPPVDGQFRGKAPAAGIFALPVGLGGRPFNDLGAVSSDTYLQEAPARTNALISNNSWYYSGANVYDIHAASYDAAVRDALPGQTGSQPVLFVFPAGNAGRGDDSGQGGDPDTIQSPGTAKNVITVGAIEQLRNITNDVWLDCTTTNINGTNVTVCTTNQPWALMTDANSEVAGLSSRGNTGVGIEGDFGRFKPDVVAPGTFVVSTRSQQWDEGAYYNPTSYVTTVFHDQFVFGSNLTSFLLFVPPDAVQLNITVQAPVDLPIYVRQDAEPTPADSPLGTNFVSLPPDAPLSPVDAGWWCAVGNSTTSNVLFDITIQIVRTNELGSYFEVLKGLNDALGPFYRYESGTSMSAADVSGTLALMQEFFARLGRTNSPALMKALLINGARSVQTPPYDLQVRNAVNLQGWGLIHLPNSLPPAITNLNAGGPSSIWLADQSPTNALATGQSQTRTVRVNGLATNEPLRITLVWTDPPGNPAAGVKLVNDLDLIVTNLNDPANPIVYFGNDFPTADLFTQPWDTNTTTNVDSVNNVENVYIPPPLGTNGYSVTVVARHVNVNAVTAHTNDVVQDYALVISSGDGDVTDGLTVTESPVTAPPALPFSSSLTNTFNTPDVVGTLLLGQHVGANTPLLGTTNGMTNQWHFYVLTNTAGFTNAAFVTFLPPTLSVPRIGVRESDPDNASRVEADIDLYVSQNPALTNLDPAAVAAADKSRTRGGTEVVAYSNSVAGAVYYVGVKSEDYMAAEYGFIGAFSLLPFSDRDQNGNVTVRGFPLPSVIPDGSPANPGAALVFGLALQPVKVRRVIATNTVSHEAFDDLLGNLSHGRQFAVLNNHRAAPGAPLPPGPYTFIYEDNGEGDIPASIPSDGPGTLRNFVGEEGIGAWLLAMVDNILNSSTGAVQGFSLRLEPQNLDSNGVVRALAPNTWTYDFIDVPVEATNLTVSVSGNTGPVELYLRRGEFPTRTVFDRKLIVNPPGDSLILTRYDLPPLSVGRWFIGVFNSSGVPQNIRITARLELDIAGVTPINDASAGNEPLPDDAVTNSTILVTNDARIATVEVGLRVDHPRISDLAFTLIAPDGTRVLLMENRGRTNTAGIGDSVTNVLVAPHSANGGAAPDTNVVDTGFTSGSLTVDYNFFCAPDRMTVYYEGNLIYDTGLINNGCPKGSSVPGRFTVNYGPGTSTQVTFVMNESGNTNATTQWEYTVSDIAVHHNYLIFTENTNLTTTPIKFAVPPFVPFGAATNAVGISDFDAAVAGEYPVLSLVDGWTVAANQVSVVNDPATAFAGQFLALASGTLTRTLPTVAGQTYTLNFAARGPDIVSWWRGENSGFDEADGNNGAAVGDMTYVPGVVGQGFTFDGNGDRLNLGNPANLQLQDFTIEAWIKRSSATTISFDDQTGSAGEGGQIVAYGQGGYAVGLADDGRIFLTRVGIDNAIVPPTIADTNWHHLAVTKLGTTVWFFVDGVRLPPPTYNPNPYVTTYTFTTPIAVGARGDGPGTFFGAIDEPSVYRRALSASEVNAIFNAGSAGKFDPGMTAPANLSKLRVTLDNALTNTLFADNTNWQVFSQTFTATQNGTPLRIEGLEPGVLLDAFTLTDTTARQLYYLPEEPLSVLAGKNARGEWKLEIWDSRTGATLQTSLVSWQLSFVFENTTPLPRPLVDGVAVTNTIPPGQIAYFVVDVPAWANYATNTLLFANPPPGVNVLFNQNTFPTFGAANPGDYNLIPNSTGGSFTLSAATTPPLVPGQRYYLGVENLTPGIVSYALQVNFDTTNGLNIITLTNDIPYFNTNSGAGNIYDYYRFVVSSNAARAQFEILGPTADMTLVVRRGLPPPNLLSYDYVSANPGTNDEFILVLTNSTPVALAPGDWYLTAANISGGPVSYAIKASETNVPPDVFIWAGVPNVDQYWSTPGNWVGNVAPPTLASNTVLFRGDVQIPYNYPHIRSNYLGPTTIIFSNNLALNGITILGGSNNTMNLGPFVLQDSPQTCHFGVDSPFLVSFGATSYWITNYNFTNGLGDATVGGQTDFRCTGGDLHVYGVLTDGAGANSRLVKSGNRTLNLTGMFPNTYTGGTIVNAGTVTLQKPAGFAALPGDATVNGTGALVELTPGGEQIADGAIVTLNDAATLDLAGRPETVQTIQSLSAAASIINVNGILTVAPMAGQTYNTGAGTGESDFLGAISGNLSGPGTLQMNGTGTYGMLGANSVANLVVNSGTLKVNGNSGTGAVTVNAGGTLLVNGTLGGTVVVAPGGTIGAGFSPGKLILGGGLTLSGATNVWELAALKDEATGVAGVDFDQIVLTGGALVMDDASTLDIRFIGSATPPNDTDPFWQLPHTWTVIALDGGFNPGPYNFGVVQNGSFAAGEFTVTANDRGIVLHYTPSLDSTNNYIWDNQAGDELWNNPVNWGILGNPDFNQAPTLSNMVTFRRNFSPGGKVKLADDGFARGIRQQFSRNYRTITIEENQTVDRTLTLAGTGVSLIDCANAGVNVTFDGAPNPNGARLKLQIDGLGLPTGVALNKAVTLTIGCDVSGAGGFLLNGGEDGPGRLVLGGNNTYTGPTTVNAGFLLVDGTTGPGSAVTVNSGGTLGGKGAIGGPVTVADGGLVSPGDSIGTLTINNDFTLAGDLMIEVNKSSSPSNDLISVSGVLTNAGAGVVQVLNYGPVLAAGDKFQIFNKPLLNGQALRVLSSGREVWTNKLAVDGTLEVLYATNTPITGDPTSVFTWIGRQTNGAPWRVPMQIATNWIENQAPPPLSSNIMIFQGDILVPYNWPFVDADYGNTILIFSNNIVLNSIKILAGSNHTVNLGSYVRQDTAQPCYFGITGPVPIVWAGSPVYTVTNAYFTNALGDASCGSQTDFQCVGGRLDVYGVLKDGAGTSSRLVKSGNFTLNLTGDLLLGNDPNTYSGGTLVNAGAIKLQKMPGVNALPGDVTVNGRGALVMNIVGGEQIADAAIVTLNDFGSLQLGGQPETVQTVQGPSAAASIALGTNGRLTVAPSAVATYNGGTGESDFAGSITGNGTVQMNGTGTYGMMGANSVANLTVNSGTLKVNGNSGTGPVNVNPGGTLLGRGVIAGPVSVADGATIGAGFSAGSLTLPAGLKFSAGVNGATNVWELAALADDVTGLAGTDFDQIVITGGALALGSQATLDLRFTGSATAPDFGDPFWQSPHSWTIISLAGGSNPGSSNFGTVRNGNYPAGTFTTAATLGGIVLTFTPNPAPAQTGLRITTITGAGTGTVTVFYTNTIPGTNYFLLVNTNLATTNWFTLGSKVATGTSDFQTDNAATNSPRYYRVSYFGTVTPPPAGQPVTITSAFVSSNSFCLSWTSVPGGQYFVQGLTDLRNTNWITASPTLTATSDVTTWCLALPSPLHFFRVVQIGAAAPSAPAITSVTRSNNTVSFQWTGPTSAQFQVQWTPTLSPPAWTNFSNVITSPSGLFSFVDDGSQTGGLGPTRFYRLVLLP
jgi:autotransporter-associated beta strand protein